MLNQEVLQEDLVRWSTAPAVPQLPSPKVLVAGAGGDIDRDATKVPSVVHCSKAGIS